jgi:hypothetical protein
MMMKPNVGPTECEEGKMCDTMPCKDMPMFTKCMNGCYTGFSCLMPPMREEMKQEEVSTSAGRLNVSNLVKWKPGQVLKVCFLDETDPVRNQKVFNIACEWKKYCHIDFEMTTTPTDAHICVYYDVTGGSYSFLGTDSKKYKDDNMATMNFGWLGDTTSDEEYHSVVLHEFGHALGFIHELQIPGESPPWDEKKVIEQYKITQDWSESETRS